MGAAPVGLTVAALLRRRRIESVIPKRRARIVLERPCGRSLLEHDAVEAPPMSYGD